tara:strand:- start:315 stop:458 length:144 start_codon:yes stop_codon:yes gene_type:complete
MLDDSIVSQLIESSSYRSDAEAGIASYRFLPDARNVARALRTGYKLP